MANKVKIILAAFVWTALFCPPALAQDKAEIVFQDGTTAVTTEYFEDGDNLVYEKNGGFEEVARDQVAEIRDYEEVEGAETVEYEGGEGSSSTSGSSGSAAAKPKKKHLTSAERGKLAKDLRATREQLAKVKAAGPDAYHGEACAATVQGATRGGGYVTSRDIYNHKVKSLENRIKRIQNKLRGK